MGNDWWGAEGGGRRADGEERLRGAGTGRKERGRDADGRVPAFSWRRHDLMLLSLPPVPPPPPAAVGGRKRSQS